jgi:small-conductance mechanosensitive channel
MPVAEENRVKAEEIVFDKAREVERLSTLTKDLQQQLEDVDSAESGAAGQKASLEQSLERVKAEIKALREDD